MRLIIFLIFFTVLSASSIRWYGDYEKAHKEALKQNKQLMIFLIEKGDTKAKNILKNVFLHQDYLYMIDKKFISVIVTKNQVQSYPIELLYTIEYPAVFFLDKNELFLCKAMDGDITPQSFKQHLKNCF
jgi:hypothetical protein